MTATSTLIKLNDRMAELGMSKLSSVVYMTQEAWDEIVHWEDEDSLKLGVNTDLQFRLKTAIRSIDEVMRGYQSFMNALPEKFPVGILCVDRKDGQTKPVEIAVSVSANKSLTISLPNMRR